MPQEEMTARFRTALMGFQKQDVLSWIDERTAEAQKRQEEAKAREAELQQQLAALQEEKQALEAQLADAKAQMCIRDRPTSSAVSDTGRMRTAPCSSRFRSMLNRLPVIRAEMYSTRKPSSFTKASMVSMALWWNTPAAARMRCV